MTLISAPAGSGKTSVLRAWAAHHEAALAWLSLDPEDNDPARFWIYVIAGLHLKEGLTIIHDPSGETVLAGSLRDQAALFEVMVKLRALGLTLLSVNPIAGEPPREKGT